MSTPEVRFKFPWLLLKTFDFALRPALEKEGAADLLDKEFILERLERHETAWRPYEQKVLEGMCSIFELEFRQNIIDMYVAPLKTSFSDPMMISTRYKPEQVVGVIAHELMHRLLTDNTLYDDRHLVSHWSELFGTEHTQVALVHIPIHAGLKMLYIDILNEPERLREDIERCQRFEPYRQAWDYVEAEGYQEIIARLKSSYATLQERQGELA
ncbi:MAG: hypothetical protein WAZ21_02380 [Candidatus Saccharimonadales bacterium]